MSQTAKLLSSRTVYPERPGERELSVEDLWAVPRVAAPAAAADGLRAAVAVKTYDMEANEGKGRIWLVPADGGDARPLTAAAEDASQPVFSPDGKSLAFLRKVERDGERRGQLHVLPLDGGEAECVTDLPLGVTDLRWFPDSSGLLFVSQLLRDHLSPEATRDELARRADDPVRAHVTENRVYRFWDHFLTTGETSHLFCLDLAGEVLRDLTPEHTGWFGLIELDGAYDVSPDGSEAAFSSIFTDGPDERLRLAVYTVPTAGGAIRDLTSSLHERAQRPRYSPDGRHIVYGMTVDPYFYADRVRLRRWDREAERDEELLVDWELSPASYEFLADGRLLLTAERDGRTPVFSLAPGEEPRALCEDGSFSLGRPLGVDRAFATQQTLQRPAEVATIDPASGAVIRRTRFTDQALDGVAIGEVRDLHFTGAAGETVQMFLMLPPNRPAGRLPLVHVIHGGPHGITGDLFHPRWNVALFAAPGYAVACVNFQGSTSRGQDYAERIQGAWGERPYGDIMAATDVLVAEGIADSERLAIGGGSYGGYLVSWIATQTDRFRCIVNHAGVFDLLGQYACDVTYGRHKSFGAEPWQEIERIDRWDPARHTAGITTPMLVIHGEKDYRVPITQGLMCYNILKAKGVPARLVYFPDENHWVLKPRNSRLWYGEVHAWLARWLGEGSAAGSTS